MKSAVPPPTSIDQHDLLALDRALVVERRRDRLELELDVAKARGARAGRKRALRFAVALVVVVVEADRAPEHDGVERASGLRRAPARAPCAGRA